MKIVFLRIGSFSGVNQGILKEIKKLHDVVAEIDPHIIIDPRSLELKAIYNFTINFFNTFFRYGRNWKIHYNSTPFAFKAMTKYCEKKLKKIKNYDLIFQTQTLFMASFKNLSKPYFVYLDYPSKLLNDKTSNNYTSLESQLFENVDAVLTFNNYLKKFLSMNYKINENKIHAVGIGINTKEFKDVHKTYKPIILSISYDFYSKKYGGKTILEAFYKLKKIRPDFELIVIGQKLNTAHIKSYFRLDHSQLEKFYKNATFFVNPGDLGGVQSTLEAMFNKCVCLVGETNPLLFGLIEDNKTAILVKPNNPPHLFDKLFELVDKKDLLIKIGNNAHKKIKSKFNWEKVILNIETIYADLIKR